LHGYIDKKMSSGLNILLQAKNKSSVEKCIRLSMVPAFDMSEEVLSQCFMDTLGLEDIREATSLATALRSCVTGISQEGVEEYFANPLHQSETLAGIDAKLVNLIKDILTSKIAEYKESSMNGLTYPRLVDHDWTVHKQCASDAVLNMEVPVVLMNLTVEEGATQQGEMPNTRKVDFELSPEALETMLDGMNRIKSQLIKLMK